MLEVFPKHSQEPQKTCMWRGERGRERKGGSCHCQTSWQRPQAGYGKRGNQLKETSQDPTHGHPGGSQSGSRLLRPHTTLCTICNRKLLARHPLALHCRYNYSERSCPFVLSQRRPSLGPRTHGASQNSVATLNTPSHPPTITFSPSHHPILPPSHPPTIPSSHQEGRGGEQDTR